MAKILVTGGLGYIGSHTVVALQEAGYEVVVVDNLSNTLAEVEDSIEKISGTRPIVHHFDVAEQGKLQNLIQDEGVEGIIHFAAFLQVNESVENPLKYYENNIGTLVSVGKAARDSGNLPIVFSSSCTVYGNPETLPVDENAPIVNSESPYGQTKIVGEQILKHAADAGDFPVISLRYFNPIGAHPSGEIGELQFGEPHHLVPYITETASGKRSELKIFGSDYPTSDGTCVRDYIHVMDLAEAHVAAMKKALSLKRGNFEAVNIGTGKGTSVLEMVKSFENATGLEVPYVLADRRAGDAIAVYASAGKAKDWLKWEASRSLDETFRDAWNWEKNLAKKNIPERENV